MNNDSNKFNKVFLQGIPDHSCPDPLRFFKKQKLIKENEGNRYCFKLNNRQQAVGVAQNKKTSDCSEVFKYLYRNKLFLKFF